MYVSLYFFGSNEPVKRSISDAAMSSSSLLTRARSGFSSVAGRISSAKYMRSSVITPSRIRRQPRYSRSRITNVPTAASPASSIARTSSV